MVGCRDPEYVEKVGPANPFPRNLFVLKNDVANGDLMNNRSRMRLTRKRDTAGDCSDADAEDE
jgi:hypothetical protein